MEFHSCRSSGVRPRSSFVEFQLKEELSVALTAAFVRPDCTDGTDGAGRTGSTIDGAAQVPSRAPPARLPEAPVILLGVRRLHPLPAQVQALQKDLCCTLAVPMQLRALAYFRKLSGRHIHAADVSFLRVPLRISLRASNTLSTAAAIASAGSDPASSSAGCSSTGAGIASSAGISDTGISAEAVSARSSPCPPFAGRRPRSYRRHPSAGSVVGTAPSRSPLPSRFRRAEGHFASCRRRLPLYFLRARRSWGFPLLG